MVAVQNTTGDENEEPVNGESYSEGVLLLQVLNITLYRWNAL
jgi:hypothetical protein